MSLSQAIGVLAIGFIFLGMFALAVYLVYKSMGLFNEKEVKE